ncbi:hypothetical protein BDE02_02G147100 [Populus trichocarpa]|nr:hypothetical protein BDE02_02G147100 [Populus trichocarpa]
MYKLRNKGEYKCTVQLKYFFAVHCQVPMMLLFASIMPFPSKSIYVCVCVCLIKFSIILSYLFSPSSLRERPLSSLCSDMFSHYTCNQFALPVCFTICYRCSLRWVGHSYYRIHAQAQWRF